MTDEKHATQTADTTPLQNAEKAHAGGCPCDACGQSPIHVQTSKAKPLPQDTEISLHFGLTPRDPHRKRGKENSAYNTVEIPGAAGSTLHIHSGDQHFEAELAQFHTHFGAEHKIDGKRHDGEIHFVFKSPEGQLAVAAVTVKAGKHANKELEHILEALGQPKVEKQTVLQRAGGFLQSLFRLGAHDDESRHVKPQIKPGHVDFKKLMPHAADVFYTIGSLTAPSKSGEFTEGVQWLIFEHPIEATQEQIDRFTKVIGQENNRSLFPVGEREVFKGKVKAVVVDRVLPRGQKREETVAGANGWVATTDASRQEQPSERGR